MSGGGGSSSKQTTTSFTPEQSAMLAKTLKAFEEQGRIGAGQTSFQGERVAPFSTGQQAAISGAEPFLDVFAAGRDIPFLGETGGALQGILSGELGGELISPERAQEVFQQTRQIPRVRQFERFDKPLIEEQFAGPGFQSTARARAVTLGAEELGRDIASEREQFLFGTEQANRALQEARAGRTLGAIPLGFEAGLQPERVAGARLAGRAGVFDFLTTQQQQQQREIQAEREIFTEAQRFMDPEDFQQLATLLNANFTTSTASSQSGGMGLGQLALGAGLGAAAIPFGTAAGAGLFTGLFPAGAGAGAGGWLGGGTLISDIRLKSNIHYLSYPLAIWSWNGIAQRLFGYSGTGIGLLAQDVEKFCPQAVLVHSSGYKMIDYSLLI